MPLDVLLLSPKAKWNEERDLEGRNAKKTCLKHLPRKSHLETSPSSSISPFLQTHLFSSHQHIAPIPATMLEVKQLSGQDVALGGQNGGLTSCI